MANNISNYLENEILDHTLGTASYTMPTTVYIALYTSDPTDADSGSEVSGGSYARQSAAFDVAAAGATQNSADITFPQATADWGTVTHIGIRDAATIGNLLWHGPLSQSKTVNNGDTFKINAGDLDISLN